MGVDEVVVEVVQEVVGAKELWSRSSATNVIQVAVFPEFPASRSAGNSCKAQATLLLGQQVMQPLGLWILGCPALGGSIGPSWPWKIYVTSINPNCMACNSQGSKFLTRYAEMDL